MVDLLLKHTIIILSSRDLTINNVCSDIAKGLYTYPGVILVLIK